ncbi:MAG TPA: lysophospholipid acyltransferase family protein [Acidimicrobiales bacterium]|nr:lysophospholipid acyltransferase family protein [Acidimicrobiales bacterium]
MKPSRFPFAKPTWPTAVPRPAPERHVGLDYDHDWSRRYPVRLARAIVLDNVTRPAARLVATTTVRGTEHLRHVTAPVIFAANHASHLDTPILLTSLPVRFRHRTVVAAAADYFFDRHWKAVLWSFSLAAIPIERARVNRRSADVASDLLGNGWNLVIFPEGGRSPDGWGQPFSPASAAYLSRRTGRPVVPVHLSGTRHVLPKSGEPRLPRRSPVSVLFGMPLSPDDGEDARKFSVRIERAVAVAADEASSDWWQARTRHAREETPSLRGPEASGWLRSWALDPRPEAGRDTWPRV